MAQQIPGQACKVERERERERERESVCGWEDGGAWHPVGRAEGGVGWVREEGDICPQSWPLLTDRLCWLLGGLLAVSLFHAHKHKHTLINLFLSLRRTSHRFTFNDWP